MTVEQMEKPETTQEVSLVDKKMQAMQEYMTKAQVNGFQVIEVNEKNKVLRSNLLIKGQTLPLFIVVNDTVYSYIQVHLVTVEGGKIPQCLAYLNQLNERFNMLKYCINAQGNVVLTCSVPASDDKFEPGLIIALVDQVKNHLEEVYPEIMKNIWQD